MLKVGFTEIYKKYATKTDIEVAGTPIIPKYFPLSRMKFIIDILVRFCIKAVKILFLKF